MEIWGRIYELFRILEEIIYTSRKGFLREVCSCYGINTKLKKPNKTIAYFITEPNNVTLAKKAFSRQVNEQMPVYVQLIKLMAAKTRTQAKRQKEEAIASVC